jgi:hypothetical protein
LPAVDAGWWPSYVERVETAARGRRARVLTTMRA